MATTLLLCSSFLVAREQDSAKIFVLHIALLALEALDKELAFENPETWDILSVTPLTGAAAFDFALLFTLAEED
eukprot:snap_masked-scaffold_2-processed-gene-6.27-mRNA-1 protein AED:1.00 eAED:1.00 QI:0/0/0/0/1/1/2/0/73